MGRAGENWEREWKLIGGHLWVESEMWDQGNFWEFMWLILAEYARI